MYTCLYPLWATVTESDWNYFQPESACLLPAVTLLNSKRRLRSYQYPLPGAMQIQAVGEKGGPQIKHPLVASL